MPRKFCDRGPKRTFLQKLQPHISDHALEDEEGGGVEGLGGGGAFAGCQAFQYIPGAWGMGEELPLVHADQHGSRTTGVSYEKLPKIYPARR